MMCGGGAQCTFPAMRKNIPVVIRNYFNTSHLGTSITSFEEDSDRLAMRTNRDSQMIKGFATIDNVSLVNVEGTGMVGVPGTASVVFSALKEVRCDCISFETPLRVVLFACDRTTCLKDSVVTGLLPHARP